MDQIEILECYKLQENGSIYLSGQATTELGWTLGDFVCEQYMDEKGQRVIVVAKDSSLLDWPEEFRGVVPLFRTYQLSKRGGLTLDKTPRNKFHWNDGAIMKQTLDRRIYGIIIERVED